MPNKEEESKWQVSYEIANKALNPAQARLKQIAVWIYHQFCLHPEENKISFESLFQKHLETFKHLTIREIEKLKKTHDQLPPHSY